MTLLEAVVLGLVQGVFMFVPVSSTSHLALTQQVMIARGSSLPSPDAPEMILFDLVVHVGTVVSIAVVMWPSLRRVLAGLAADLADRIGGPAQREGRFLRLALLGLLTVAVTGAVGLVGRPLLALGFDRPPVVAASLIATGAILWWTDVCGPRPRGLRQITVMVAVGIGLAQAVALAPGLSRSGLTIAAALALGLRRRWAAEYSFFVAIPTILAATGMQGVLMLLDDRPLNLDAGAIAAAFVVAAVVGALALKLVLALLYRARFRVFSVYVWALAALVLLLVAIGWLPADGSLADVQPPTG